MHSQRFSYTAIVAGWQQISTRGSQFLPYFVDGPEIVPVVAPFLEMNDTGTSVS